MSNIYTTPELKALYEKRSDINKQIEDTILQENIRLNEGKTFKVVFSVFFGGSSIIGENLSYSDALDLLKNTATDVYENVDIIEE